MAALLVSVRDASEAAAALEGGADVIDVKDPDKGALGRAHDGVRESVLDVVGERAPVSAALGELADGGGPIDVARLAFVKYGLADCLRRPASRSRPHAHRPEFDWRWLLTQARQRVEVGPCRLVVVAYADWRRAEAPPPDAVFRHAIEQRAAAVLVDTWNKDGSTLLNWLSVGEVERLCGEARSAGVRVALAGSLGPQQIAALKAAIPDWFAVRGAACSGGNRTARIDAGRVRELAELVR
jgi:uncharacterized protein (UPF0264 family)